MIRGAILASMGAATAGLLITGIGLAGADEQPRAFDTKACPSGFSESFNPFYASRAGNADPIVTSRQADKIVVPRVEPGVRRTLLDISSVANNQTVDALDAIGDGRSTRVALYVDSSGETVGQAILSNQGEGWQIDTIEVCASAHSGRVQRDEVRTESP